MKEPVGQSHCRFYTFVSGIESQLLFSPVNPTDHYDLGVCLRCFLCYMFCCEDNRIFCSFCTQVMDEKAWYT